MRKDHEEQLQRLKLLKDREIDAVTSATSHTRCVSHSALPTQGAGPGPPQAGVPDRSSSRSLNGIIEQMEKFSSSLNVLSSRVEASHLTSSQERELGIRQQDEQLRGTHPHPVAQLLSGGRRAGSERPVGHSSTAGATGPAAAGHGGGEGSAAGGHREDGGPAE